MNVLDDPPIQGWADAITSKERQGRQTTVWVLREGVARLTIIGLLSAGRGPPVRWWSLFADRAMAMAGHRRIPTTRRLTPPGVRTPAPVLRWLSDHRKPGSPIRGMLRAVRG